MHVLAVHAPGNELHALRLHGGIKVTNLST
jgi:hypothetical protein